VKLLSGGNPQIPKGEGDGPVQDYIAAMPDWKQGIGRKIDKIIGEVLPEARKAVKWNSPFYGAGDEGWFLNFHCFPRYVKIAFFNGGSLEPPPPGNSKYPAIRYLHIHEGEDWDEKQFADWVKQASQLPGEKM